MQTHTNTEQEAHGSSDALPRCMLQYLLGECRGLEFVPDMRVDMKHTSTHDTIF